MKTGNKLKGALIAFGAGVILFGLVAAAPAFRTGRGMEILVNMFRELTLYYVDEVDPDRLLEDAADGMVKSLDPYTEYLPEEHMEGFQQMTTGKYGGVGSLIRQDGDYVRFAEPYKGSPADRAGIVIGDRIMEIEGVDAKGMTTQQISDKLKGDPGTTVRLKIEKFYTGQIEELKIRREIIARSGIPFYGMVNDSVGYVIHSDFTEDCSGDMRNAVMSLKGQGARSLIIDYRGNGGGIMQEAVKIVSFFVPKGTEVVSMRGRSAETSATFVTQSEPIDTEIPLVLIVDSGSASASEIVTGALQDLDRAVLVGSRTYGKGLVQSPRYIGYNSYLKLTTAKYYLPSGRCIQAIDYASRGEDGGISYIPDSLVNEFHTRAGRKVYDGGGVMPDSVLKVEYVSRFAYLLYGLGHVSDFADVYAKDNREKAIVPGEFVLSDSDYAGFVAFMDEREVEWESETQRSLKLLREIASRERYIDDIEVELDAIGTKLKDDKRSNLELYGEEIRELIENEIILRRAYSEGVSEHNFRKNEPIVTAAEILADPEAYREILARDTRRK